MKRVVIIGGGHNGLTAALALAREGRRVTLLERRDCLGGRCAGEEFAPGYRHAGLLHDTSLVRDEVLSLLGGADSRALRSASAPSVFVPSLNGPGLLLDADASAACDELAVHSPRDAESYARYLEWIARIRPAIAPLLNEVPPDPGNLGWMRLLALARRMAPIRRLGRRDMLELLRCLPMSVRDFLDERFESPLLKVALAGPALIGDGFGPRSPQTAARLILHACTASGALGGGPAALVRAMVEAADRLGVMVRTGAEVEEVLVREGAAVGVRLVGGETIEADQVLAAGNPRLLPDLLPARALPLRAEQRLRRFRSRGVNAVLHLALRGPFELRCRPGARFEHARIAETLDDFERAADAGKYRRTAERPVLDVYLPQPSLAPAGGHVASVLIHGAPYDHAVGWGSAQRTELLERVLDVLDEYAVELRDRIVAHELLTPGELEERYRLPEGHLLHGEHGLDQVVVRPIPELGRYATPLSGLFVTGGGCFPGGEISGAPGRLAARRMLSER